MFSLQAAVVAFAALGSGETVLLDFTADWCGPCRQMSPVVDQLAGLGYPVRKVNVDQEQQLAAQHKVGGIPCFVLLVDGREVDRMVGAASSDALKRMFEKAGVGAGGRNTQFVGTPATPVSTPSSSSAASRAPSLDSFVNPPQDWAHSPVTRGQSPDTPSASIPLATTPAAGPLGTPQSLSNPAPSPAQPSGAIRANAQELIAASVRLKIEDGDGHSYGSGTIIDSRGDLALILTCGHVFRDSNGQGRISVDMFGPGARQGLEAQLVGYDLDRDVGLVSFRPGVPVKPARVAGPGHRVNRGEPVVSVGCDNGADASLRESRISAIDKYLGPPNLEVAGQPVQGRSGGGLFNADGLVIGVCNAADPSDDEGLYAAVASIHAILDKEGLASIYQQSGTQLAQGPGTSATPMAPLVDIKSPPQMPGTMPQPAPANAALTSGTGQLTPDEQLALDALRNQHPGSEVICVIRPHADPRAKSQVIVLDNASPAFMQQLAVERQRQDARHLTAFPASTQTAQPVTARYGNVDAELNGTQTSGPATPQISQRPLKWTRPSVN